MYITKKLLSNPLIDEFLHMRLVLPGQFVRLYELGQLDDLILVLAFFIGSDKQIFIDGVVWVFVALVCEHHQLSVYLFSELLVEFLVVDGKGH